MDQNVTGYGGRPRPSPQCVTWGLSPRIKGSQPPSVRLMPVVDKRLDESRSHFYKNVSLVLGHIVLHGNPVPPPQKVHSAQPPIFGRCLLWPNGRPSQLLLGTCYTLFHKKRGSQLISMTLSTDFQNSFIVRLCDKFAIM